MTNVRTNSTEVDFNIWFFNMTIWEIYIYHIHTCTSTQTYISTLIRPCRAKTNVYCPLLTSNNFFLLNIFHSYLHPSMRFITLFFFLLFGCLTVKGHMSAMGIKTYAKLPMGCSPLASMMYSCVNAETFLHCPAKMWKDEEHCNVAKSFAAQCNPLPHVPLPIG